MSLISKLSRVDIKDADEDFKRLVDISPELNSSYIGNKALNVCFFKWRAKEKNRKGISLEDVEDDPKLYNYFKKKGKMISPGEPEADQVYDAYTLYSGAIYQFKPFYAKYLYTLFKPNRVLDFSAGWGGRLLGALSLGVDYIGIDPNEKLEPCFTRLIERYNIHNAKIKMIWDYAEHVDYEKLKPYDMVLTSPPHDELEIYNKKKYEDYYTDFLIPVLDKVYESLSKGGHMCINISTDMFDKLIGKYGYKKPDSKIKYPTKIRFKNYKYEQYTYIWKK